MSILPVDERIGGRMNCKGCKVEGAEGPIVLPWEDPFDKLDGYGHIDGLILFELDGTFYCNPCVMKISSKCYQCGSRVDTLYMDRRCKVSPYVCKGCLDKSTTNHLRVCYSNGCMTPGEIAQEEFNLMKIDGVI